MRPKAEDIIEVTDGRITGPGWLVDEMEKVADRYKDASGIGKYPFVYIFEYNGQEHICLWDMYSSDFYRGELFFTLDGRQIPEFDPGTGKPIDEDLWFDIEHAVGKTCSLFWTPPHAQSKSPATRLP